MKAVAISPGKRNSAHLAKLSMPRLEEINAAEYGAAPPGYDFLVPGHESFGAVEQVGPGVTEVAPGDYVVAMVRRPGSSIYDVIGMPDMTTDDTYHEHGINLVHGFLTENYVDAPENIVRVPGGLREVGVLVEPLSIAEKGIFQAYKIQRRLPVYASFRPASGDP